MVLPINLKFGMYIIGHRSSRYINFDAYGRYSFPTIYTKYHTLRPIGSKYLKCILMFLNYLKSRVRKVEWNHSRYFVMQRGVSPSITLRHHAYSRRMLNLFFIYILIYYFKFIGVFQSNTESLFFFVAWLHYLSKYSFLLSLNYK